MTPENIKEVTAIMFEKLKEMSELTIEDFDDIAEYNGCCSVMCDIYKALTENNT